MGSRRNDKHRLLSKPRSASIPVDKISRICYVIPLAKSGILSAMLLTLITTMRVLDIIVLLVTPRTRTMTSIIFRYQTQGFVQHAYAIMLIIIVITLSGHFLLRRLGGRVEL